MILTILTYPPCTTSLDLCVGVCGCLCVSVCILRWVIERAVLKTEVCFNESIRRQEIVKQILTCLIIVKFVGNWLFELHTTGCYKSCCRSYFTVSVSISKIFAFKKRCVYRKAITRNLATKLRIIDCSQ